MRQSLRRMCRESLYFFNQTVMVHGLARNLMTPRVHQVLCDFLQRETCPKHPAGCRRKFVAMPRGFLKTAVGTKPYAIWRYLRDANIRILLANEKAENAEKFLSEIRQQFERNGMLQWLFPEAIPEFSKTTWNDHEILLPRQARWSEGTIETIGVGGSVVSRHYNLILVDDPVGRDDMYSATLLADKVEWFRALQGLLVPPIKESEIVVIGNRWAKLDVGGHILENCPEYDVLLRRIQEGGEPLWPEGGYTREVIDQLLEDEGPRLFSALRMNDPTSENPASLDETWIRYFVMAPLGLMKVLFTDAALGESAGSDYTAIGVVGMDRERNRYLLDLTYDHLGVDEIVEEIIRLYLVHRPAKVAFQKTLFEKVLTWPLREAMRRHKVTLPLELVPVDRSTDAKKKRISKLQPPLARGHYFFPGAGYEPKAGFGPVNLTGLLKEYRNFPDATVHDDALDMLSLADQLLTEPAAHTVPEPDPRSYEAIRKELRDAVPPAGPFAWHKLPGYAGASA